MQKIYIIALASIYSLMIFSGCKKKTEDTTFNYAVPTSYNQFTNVNYSDVQIRLNMFKSIEAEMKKPTTGIYTIPTQKLKNMFANSGSPFTDSVSWNSLSINLRDQVNPTAQAVIDGYLDIYTQASASAVVASYGDGNGGTGTAGLGTTSPTPKKVLFSANNINYAQSFQKIMFGGLLIYQIDNILTNISANDNSVKVTGKTYTAQEHAWDQAFGYLGFSSNYTVDSLTNTNFIAAHKALYFYIGNYSTQVDAGIQSSQALLNAFLKGRAAISNGDGITRDAQVAIIIAELEKFLAACAIHEINELTADNNAKFNDPASKCSSLSESMGFITAMKYNPKRTVITDAQIDDILSHYHTGSTLNDVTLTDAAYIKNTIAAIYGLTSLKDII